MEESGSSPSKAPAAAPDGNGNAASAASSAAAAAAAAVAETAALQPDNPLNASSSWRAALVPGSCLHEPSHPAQQSLQMVGPGLNHQAPGWPGFIAGSPPGSQEKTRGGLYDDKDLIRGVALADGETTAPPTAQGGTLFATGSDFYQNASDGFSHSAGHWSVQRPQTPLLAYVDRANFPGFVDPDEYEGHWQQRARGLEVRSPRNEGMPPMPSFLLSSSSQTRAAPAAAAAANAEVTTAPPAPARALAAPGPEETLPAAPPRFHANANVSASSNNNNNNSTTNLTAPTADTSTAQRAAAAAAAAVPDLDEWERELALWKQRYGCEDMGEPADSAAPAAAPALGGPAAPGPAPAPSLPATWEDPVDEPGVGGGAARPSATDAPAGTSPARSSLPLSPSMGMGMGISMQCRASMLDSDIDPATDQRQSSRVGPGPTMAASWEADRVEGVGGAANPLSGDALAEALGALHREPSATPAQEEDEDVGEEEAARAAACMTTAATAAATVGPSESGATSASAPPPLPAPATARDLDLGPRPLGGSGSPAFSSPTPDKEAGSQAQNPGTVEGSGEAFIEDHSANILAAFAESDPEAGEQQQQQQQQQHQQAPLTVGSSSSIASPQLQPKAPEGPRPTSGRKGSRPVPNGEAIVPASPPQDGPKQGRYMVYGQEDYDEATTSALLRLGPGGSWKSGYFEAGLQKRDFFLDLRKQREREKGRCATGPIWAHLSMQAKNLANTLNLKELLEVMKLFCSVRYDDYELYMRILGEVPHYIKEATAGDLCELIRLLARRRLRERNYVDMVAAHLLQKIRITDDYLPSRLLVKAANSFASLECRSQPKFVEHFLRHFEHRIEELDADICCMVSPLFVANYMADALRRAYLKRCAEVQAGFQGPEYDLRNLACTELVIRKEHHSFLASLPPFVGRYLEKVRQHAFFDKWGSVMLPPHVAPDGPKGAHRSEMSKAAQLKASTATGSTRGDVFNSDMHRDVSACLTHLGIEHENGVVAGPYLLDIVALDMVNPMRRIVYEVNSPHHYYEGTQTLTAEMKLRHRMLNRLGHRLHMVNTEDWVPLTSAQKMTFLLRLQQAQQDKNSEEAKQQAAANTMRAPLPVLRPDSGSYQKAPTMVQKMPQPIRVPIPPSRRGQLSSTR